MTIKLFYCMVWAWGFTAEWFGNISTIELCEVLIYCGPHDGKLTQWAAVRICYWGYIGPMNYFSAIDSN